MEGQLATTFFAPDLLARLGLAAMELTEVRCQQTTCRMQYQFPTALMDLVAAAGQAPASPMVLVEEAVGWAAPRGDGFHRTVFQRDGQPHTAISVVLGFDEGSWDPEAYRQWVAEQRPATQEFYRRARLARARRLAGSDPAGDTPVGAGDAG